MDQMMQTNSEPEDTLPKSEDRDPDLAVRPSRSAKKPYLTKSKFVDGQICPKLLWLSTYEPVPFEPAEAGSIQAVGTEIGSRARELFPGGVLVDAPAYAHKKAVAETEKLMRNKSVPAIFEAAFEWNDIRIRVDILERGPKGSWRLIEVKSATRVKPDYVEDAALQLHVVRGLGIDVPTAELLHVDRDYARGIDGIDWEEYFTRSDITAEVESLIVDMDDVIARQFDILASRIAPVIEPGRHCPDDCDYWEQCTAEKPEDWILQLPALSQQKYDRLTSRGIDAISDIPEDFPLSAVQSRIRTVVKTGEDYIGEFLTKSLDNLDLPVAYLDFEAMNPAIPLFPENRPYQQIPFQWSLHYKNSDGELSHEEYLASGREDPRREFATSLVDLLAPGKEPIAVYSGYESWTLKSLGQAFPDLEDYMEAITGRFVDLLQIVRQHVYLEDFGGSFSIKNVGPALVPDFSYGDIGAITDGFAASNGFQRIAAGAFLEGESETSVREDLLAYCKHDTLAMVKIHEALIALQDQSR